MMIYTLDNFQQDAWQFAIYPDKGEGIEGYGLTYAVLGLAGEAGELANVTKKILRDGLPDEWTTTNKLAAELGDVLWYVAAVASELGLELGDIAVANLEKLRGRASRGTIGGSGEDR
jgi:NTP pyrophosphatase (non-canonical NTP hydrolase)